MKNKKNTKLRFIFTLFKVMKIQFFFELLFTGQEMVNPILQNLNTFYDF